jgi:hypothetical protein
LRDDFLQTGFFSGSSGDPKTVPEIPVKPFKVVAPNDSLEIKVNLRARVIRGLKPGVAGLQLVAENWPQQGVG